MLIKSGEPDGNEITKFSMTKFLKNTWEYFFAPWEITILEEGSESWTNRSRHYGVVTGSFDYVRYFVKYKHSHKFRKEEKIVKVYLN